MSTTGLIDGSMSLDINEPRGMLEAAQRRSADFIGLLHDIDGTSRGGGTFRNRRLWEARDHIEAALELIREHITRAGA